MNKNLFKNTIIIGIGTVCTKLLSFLMVPLYTSWLLPDEYGEFDLLVSYLSLLVPIITLQLEQAVFKWCLTNKDDSKKVFYNGIIITIVNIFIVNLLCYFLFSSKNFIIPFMLYFDSYALFVFLSEYLRGQKKLKYYSLYNILVSVLSTILSFIMVPFLNFGMIGLLLAFGIAYITIDIIILFCEKLLFGFKFKILNKKTIKEMICYSLPLIPNAISWWITSASDRSIIKIIIGNYYNGLYAVGCKIPTIISIIYGIFNLSWQQEAITTYKDSDRDMYYNKIFSNLISFLFCGGIVIISLLPIFFDYIVSSEYSSALYVTPYLVIGAVFLSLGQFMGGILLAESKTKKIGYTTAIAAVINIIVNILFMKKYGLIIAGISTMISYIYFFIRRYSMIKILHLKKHIKKIIIYLLIISIVTFITLNIKNLLTNIFLILFLCIFSIIENKNLIKSIINKFLFKSRLYHKK